jgi:hypothetical protein
MDAYVLQPNNWLHVVDHKTGKIKPQEHEIQSDLYALAGFVRFPNIAGIVSEFWYADHGELLRITYTRDEFDSLNAEWAKRIKPMFADRKFLPRPNPLCRFCHFRRDNGGPCRY